MTAGEFIPLQITKLFMDADESVLKTVPGAFRLHFTVYVFLCVTVLDAYYRNLPEKPAEPGAADGVPGNRLVGDGGPHHRPQQKDIRVTFKEGTEIKV